MKKTFIYILINIIIYANIHRVEAQGFSCGASAAQEKLYQNNPKLTQITQLKKVFNFGI